MVMSKKRIKYVKKSPLKVKPLPNAGASIRTQMRDVLDDAMATWVFVPTAFFMVTAYEWIRWVCGIPPIPVSMTIFLAGLIGVSFFKACQTRKKLLQMRQGLDGELLVSQELQESLSPLGYTLINDIPGRDFNIDHVAVGPGGVFVIETKTISKRATGNPKVIYDGISVTVDGYPMDRNPVDQVKACSKFIESLIASQSGKKIFSKPVVVFPGWWVECTARDPKVWVINHQQLAPKLKYLPKTLSLEDRQAIVEGLKRHIRSQDD